MRSRPTPLAPLRRQRLPMWLAWLLALALLGAQGLGLGHALAHGHGLPAAVAGVDGDFTAADATDGPSLFAGHQAGSAACRLLDQLAPDALVLPALALPHVLPPGTGCSAVAPASRALPAPCLPQARAPPTVGCA